MEVARARVAEQLRAKHLEEDSRRKGEKMQAV